MVSMCWRVDANVRRLLAPLMIFHAISIINCNVGRIEYINNEFISGLRVTPHILILVFSLSLFDWLSLTLIGSLVRSSSLHSLFKRENQSISVQNRDTVSDDNITETQLRFDFDFFYVFASTFVHDVGKKATQK